MIFIFGLNDTREKVYDKLFQHIQNEEIVREVEKGIVDYTCNHLRTKYPTQEMSWNNKTTRRIYLRKYRSMIFNIDSIKTHLSNGILPSDIPYMNYYEINPDVWKDILNNTKRREIASLVAYNDTVCDGLLTCFECKSKKTRYTTMQTRSGDEATTIYARCCECGHVWIE